MDDLGSVLLLGNIRQPEVGELSEEGPWVSANSLWIHEVRDNVVEEDGHWDGARHSLGVCVCIKIVQCL